jgi:radical SAM superfamily enzyme with C-terminal helix-hairpin-helix motif
VEGPGETEEHFQHRKQIFRPMMLARYIVRRQIFLNSNLALNTLGAKKLKKEHSKLKKKRKKLVKAAKKFDFDPEALLDDVKYRDPPVSTVEE